jgi:nitrite reductase/ring-hydroxylating ferredoxin subunit
MSSPAEPQHWHELPHAPEPGTALCSAHSLTDGHATLLELDTGGGPAKPFRLLLLRSGAQVTAFVNRCAHFGVPLAAKQAQLIFKPHTSITCNVHYARYRWADGVCESGECEGESLLPVPLEQDEAGLLRIGLPQ